MASDNANLLEFIGFIYDPTQISYADATSSQLIGGHSSSEQVVSDVHGKIYTANYRGKLFEANIVNSTMPAIGANLVSVFSLINPPSSNVNAELVDTTVTNWLAAVFVDVVGWYYSPVTALFAGTFTTLGTTNSGEVGNNPPNKVLFYSAYTHSGTPKLVDVIGSFGATSNVSTVSVTKLYDGRLILPPGNAMSVALSTTGTGTFQAFNVECRWSEWPV